MDYKNIEGFPQGFMWGASTSAFQIEGAWDKDGKGESTADRRSSSHVHQADTKIAMDHYHRYKEDIALMRELGMKSYRFSIAWTRIYPNGNDAKPNEAGLKFYSDLIDELLRNNIEPIVTIYHFDYPESLVSQYDGWVSRRSIDDFVRYAKTLFEHYGSRVKYWLPINEQMVMAIQPDLLGIREENPELLDKKRHQANHHMFLAIAKTIKLLREMVPSAKIGPAVSYITALPESMKAEDTLAAEDVNNIVSFSLMDIHYHGEYPKYYLKYLAERDWMPVMLDEDAEILKGARPDFLAVNWYCTMGAKYAPNRVDQKRVDDGNVQPAKTGMIEPGIYEIIKNPFTDYNPWGWNVDPVGLRLALQRLKQRYNLPVMITENGYGDYDTLVDGKIHDDKRVHYLRAHIEQMKLAINDGVEIFSYNPWSFIDVLSSSNGIEKRYGLVYIERTDSDVMELKRIKKDSYHYYQKVIASNGEIL